jgi:hypothetical protein
VFHPGFHALFDSAASGGGVTKEAVVALGRQVTEGVYAFPMLQRAFCERGVSLIHAARFG